MNPQLHTNVCDLLGCDYPVVLAGMGGVARSELVAAVTQAGGYGFLGMVREPPQRIHAEIDRVRAHTPRSFGVNLIPAATEPTLLEAELAACIEARIAAVTLFWDLYPEVVRRLRDEGILVVCQVGSAQEAEEAQEAGAHLLVAQGREAGGHVRGRQPLRTLLPEILAATDLPVLAAGGLVDGRDLAAVLSIGAQGAMLGTAFLATQESFAHDYHKRRIIEASPDQTLLTQAFHINWPPGASVRVLANSVTRGERGDPYCEEGEKIQIGDEEGRPVYLFSTDSPLRTTTGDLEAMALYAGEGVGRVTAIVPAAERLRSIVAEAEAVLRDNSAARGTDRWPTEPNSPVCFAAAAEDTYMGYASRDEILAFLMELLEAERAGARVTQRTALSCDNESLRELLRSIHADEARWCRLLLGWIRRLGGQPSVRVGGFYEKAMAIPETRERIAFINKGQRWVGGKLREMLPRIREDQLRQDLSDMLSNHDANIVLANDRLGPRRSVADNPPASS